METGAIDPLTRWNDNANKRGRVFFIPHHNSYAKLTDWWLPYFKDLERFAARQTDLYGSFKWASTLQGSFCDVSREDSQLREKIPRGFFYPSKFSPDGQHHRWAVHWEPNEAYPDFGEYCQQEYKAEIEAYRRQSEPHLWYHCPTFEVIMDSRFQHPSSDFAYSAIRMDLSKTKHQRARYYAKNYDNIWPIMSGITDFAMLMDHNLISMEPSCMGSMTMRRINFGLCLNFACMGLSVAAIISANYRARYPSFYVFPWLLANYLSYIYSYEYDMDPMHQYTFWSTWTNDPGDSDAFLHLQIPADLLKEEKMTFLQIEDLEYIKTINNLFCNTCTMVCVRTLFRRLKYKDSAGDIAWEILKRKVGKITGRGIHYAIGSKYHRCTYKPAAGYPERMLSWFSIIIMSIMIFLPYLRRAKRHFDEKTRCKMVINKCTFRAMTGERRYLKMVEPFYYVFQHKYPRDPFGTRLFWYLSQRYRHTPAGHQNHY